MCAFFGKILKASQHAGNGILFAFRNESAFRYECALTCLAGCAALYFAQGARDFFYLLSPLVTAMAFELCNTALEQTVNVIANEEIKPVFKVIKDCAAGAVFIMLCWGGTLWIFYFMEKFLG